MRLGSGQPAVNLCAGVSADDEILSVEQAGTILAGCCGMRLVEFQKNRELEFNALSEDGRHADLARRFLAVCTVLNDIFCLGSQSNNDVHGTLQDLINQLVVHGRNFAPCGVAVACTLGDVALYIQQATFTSPCMGERIDDEEFYTVLLCQIDSLQIACRTERRLQIDGQILTDSDAGELLANVERTGFVLRVDDADLLPDFLSRESRVRGMNLTIAEQQGAERLAAAGRTGDADLQLGQRALSFSDLNCHMLTSILLLGLIALTLYRTHFSV